MKHIKNLLLAGLIGSALCACDPIEDREVLGEPIPDSEVKYSVTQQSGSDYNVIVENQTPNSIAYWEYKIGTNTFTSTRAKDTITFVFPGTYWIKYKAFTRGGSSSVDSVQVTTTQLCGDCITDPDLINLTNKAEGKYWKLFRVTLGDAAQGHTSVWGEPSWWDPASVHYNDSAYFDLNNAFNYIRFHNGQQIATAFALEHEVLPNKHPDVDAGPAIQILGDNQMSVRDGSGEMAPENKSRYKIFYLNSDTLVVGQGAYYTADRPDQNWGYFHWYVSVK